MPKKKKCKKENWLADEALPMAEQRRDSKDKGEKGKLFPNENIIPENSKER